MLRCRIVSLLLSQKVNQLGQFDGLVKDPVETNLFRSIANRLGQVTAQQHQANGMACWHGPDSSSDLSPVQVRHIVVDQNNTAGLQLHFIRVRKWPDVLVFIKVILSESLGSTVVCIGT